MTSPLLVALLFACGDNGGGTASVGGTGSTTNGTDPTSTSTTNGSVSATQSSTDEPTGGTVGQTDSATSSTSTTSETTSTTGTTGDDTTQGVVTMTTGTSAPDTTTTTEGSSTSTTTTESSSTGVESTGGGEEPCACPDIEVPLDDGIFVLSDDAELWKFFPADNSFQMLGAFNCNGNNSTFSMAVDRLGFAWVMMNNPQGDIFKLDVTQPNNCVDPGYNPGQQGVNFFGMAFVSNNEFDQCDSLYGNTWNGIGGFSEAPNVGDFLNLDPETLQITKISKSNFNGAEMTGTGDGRVFSFGGVPSKLIERDKANGDVLSTFPLDNLPLTNAFAFAFFGGDFYFFTEANAQVSKVTHLDYDDSDNDGMQELTTVVNAGPIRIVGAGVSTCAPFVPM